MTKCIKCGETLEGPSAECQVCATLAASGDGKVMADDLNKKGKGPDLSGQSPALGASSPTTVTFTSSPTPNPASPPPPPPPGGTQRPASTGPGRDPDEDPEYRRKFEEAALEFGSDAYVFKQLERLKQRKIPAILFLGVETSGKTWLIQRMKHRLRDDYQCRPPLAIAEGRAMDSTAVQDATIRSAEEEATEAQQLELRLTQEETLRLKERVAANESNRTGAIIFHRFSNLNTRSFVLIDVPGERVEKIGKEEFSGQRGLLAALDYARAIIVAMPSDVVLLGKQLSKVRAPGDCADALADLKDGQRRLDDFINGIETIATVRHFIKHNDIPLRWPAPGEEKDDFALKVTGPNVEDHFDLEDENGNRICEPIGGADGRDCPAFFALTKADRFFAAINQLPDTTAMSGVKQRGLFKAANTALEEIPAVRLLRKCYADSPINPDKRQPDNDLASRFMRGTVGDHNRVIDVSNPFELVRTFNKALFNRLTSYMPLSRMDLVASFYGNTSNTLRNSDLDETGFVGVDELIAWLGEVRGNGIGEWHVWARSVFRQLYGSHADFVRLFAAQDKDSAGERALNVQGGFSTAGKYARRKRIRWVPRPVLKAMFQKRPSLAQWLPGGLSVVGGLALAYATVGLDWWPYQPLVYKEGATYGCFATLLDAATADNSQQVDCNNAPPKAIKAIPKESAIPPELKAKGVQPWYPLSGLKGWSAKGDTRQVKEVEAGSRQIDGSMPEIEYENVPGGAMGTPKETPGNRFLETRKAQQKWMDDYVCRRGALFNDLSDWGNYRDIVRLAIINGYGDCSGTVRAAAYSPAIAALGPAGGILAIIFGWLFVAGAGYYARWYSHTRKAYAWLYHSAAATSYRAPAQDANVDNAS